MAEAVLHRMHSPLVTGLGTAAWVELGLRPASAGWKSFQTGNKILVSSIELYWTLRKEVPMLTSQDLIERA